MNVPTREDLIELGLSLPLRPLLEWVREQTAATKSHETRLQRRGLSAGDITEIRTLAALFEQQPVDVESTESLPPQPVALAQRHYEEGSAYRREIHRIVTLGFAAQPDLLAAFRTGVRTGLLLGNLIRELSLTLPILREHASPLESLGVTATFLNRGTLLLSRLEEAKRQLDATCQALPPAQSRQVYLKGLLYDRTRRLVRIARLEFLHDPQQSANFNFSGVNRERGISTRPRLKTPDRSAT